LTLKKRLLVSPDDSLWLTHQRVVCALINEWDAIRSCDPFLAGRSGGPTGNFIRSTRKPSTPALKVPLPQALSFVTLHRTLPRRSRVVLTVLHRMQMRCCTSHPFSRIVSFDSNSFKFKSMKIVLKAEFADFTDRFELATSVDSWSRQPACQLTPPCHACTAGMKANWPICRQ
jgi:hypothetical protein